MGVRDRLERVAAWFGFGVDEDDYYEEEEEGRSTRRSAEPETVTRTTSRTKSRARRSNGSGGRSVPQPSAPLWATYSAARRAAAGSVPTAPRAGLRRTLGPSPTGGCLRRGSASLIPPASMTPKLWPIASSANSP